MAQNIKHQRDQLFQSEKMNQDFFTICDQRKDKILQAE
jgi:hypothetical protein